MNIIILGGGRVGYNLARQLVSEDKQVTVIEKSLSAAKQLANTVDCHVINDEGNSPTVLREAGIEDADFFVAVTDSDEINMISCGLVAAEFTKPVTIARVRNIDYSASRMLENPLFGINHVVNPEIETARVILRAIERGAKSNILLFDQGDLQLCDVFVPEDSPFVGKPVQLMRAETESNFLIALLNRNDEYMIPSGETVIFAGDKLHLLGSEAELDSVLEINGRHTTPIHRIAIVGGGKISRYIADQLYQPGDSGNNIFKKLLSRMVPKRRNRVLHFIEQDYDKSKELIERYPDAHVTNADISSEGILEEGDIEGYDLLLTATGNQELNIITAMYAKKLGISRTIALVQRRGYVNMAHELGIDVVVSLNNALVNSILKIIRRGNVRSIHSISDSLFEIIEFSIEKGSPIAGKSIREIRLPKQSLIMLVVRENEQILPHGDFTLQLNDRVFVIARTDDMKKVEGAITGK
ncbi:Trk system potassium transporter TrkA [Marispirochaeta sp.]|jgi:trk system potassium uptake protein|uniref:Trk system potassium transporter TrkA n=1 Tax=Marispirochaeta sp. TaxID=2038653 RepID=UPI0029C8E5F4|nr:Trk system potassium transporter TrkA [Marispirochaeta sp.]